MKKLLTIILTVVMLLGVLAVNTSAADPSVSIITNEGSAVKTGDTIYFTIKFDNFDTIKGMDVTITSNAAGVLQSVASITGFANTTATKDGNYTVSDDGKQIRFVDLTGSAKSGKIAIETEAPSKTATITVTGKYAETGNKLFEKTLEINKDIEVKPAETTDPDVKKEWLDTNTDDNADIYTISVNSGKFVPYGAVYKLKNNKYTFANKETAENFTIEKGDTDTYSYKEYDLPKISGITTFGVAEDPIRPGNLRFGSYSTKHNQGYAHGTMVFEGNYLALKNYYLKNGYTVSQFVTAIYKNASATLNKEENKGKKFVFYNIPGTNDGSGTPEKINVYLFEQKNYMWKDDDSKVLEFAVSLSGVKSSTQYAAVAYAVNGDQVIMSETVKSETAPAAQ